MGRVVFYFLFFVVAIQHIEAKAWYMGTVVLKDRKTLTGEISIQHFHDVIRQAHDVILFRDGDHLTVFPAHKVISFYIHDPDEECDRQFIAMKIQSGAATFHRFYEVVLSGDISVLRRQHVAWYSSYLDVAEFDYFISSGEQLTPMGKFRRKVYPKLLQLTSGRLSSYARKNKLSMYRLRDVITAIDYFNSLSLRNDAMAKN